MGRCGHFPYMFTCSVYNMTSELMVEEESFLFCFCCRLPRRLFLCFFMLLKYRPQGQITFGIRSLVKALKRR